MASPLSADRLLAALRAEGVTVVEHDGWRTHSRNHVGGWGPVNGVMIHHTVSSGTASSVELCYDGYAGLPGPLCHGVIAKDGTVHLVGNGRANHAGGGDPSVLAAVVDERYGTRPPTPHQHQGSAGAVDGNAHFYGFECINLGDGKDPWPPEQMAAIERVSAAICRAHGWGAKSVIGHSEWSDWKSDPRGFGMPGMRDRIGTRLAAAPTKTTPVPAPEEAAVSLSDADIRKVADAVWGARFVSPAAPDSAPRPAAAFLRWGDQHTVDILARIGALSAAVTALAQAGGLDASEIQAAAEAGARAALAELGDRLTTD
ncbi:N-acetylmuramoyl-L-alanine amidase [Streptomyces sp. NBC_01216]|uniref:N-acetylmuramoyl-L-alanine amidase n=1 Tax=Streptomyces sp. NBC_01216 TaxID=2903778 RepID=UPI002E115796|nr:N-acetylmuramoyl-L-alanine amidase [Streptomyces sp. NBC_01216]